MVILVVASIAKSICVLLKPVLTCFMCYMAKRELRIWVHMYELIKSKADSH